MAESQSKFLSHDDIIALIAKMEEVRVILATMDNALTTVGLDSWLVNVINWPADYPDVAALLQLVLINANLTMLTGALDSVGTDKLHVKSEMLIQSEYDRTCTRDANGRLIQVVITSGPRTKTIDITRDPVTGRWTAINETVT